MEKLILLSEPIKLVNDKINYKDLGLLIIDEEQNWCCS